MPIKLPSRHQLHRTTGIALVVVLSWIVILALTVVVEAVRLNARFGSQPLADQLRRFLSSQPLAGAAEGRVNVLLLGMPGRGRAGAFLPDTLLLLSVFPVLQRATLLSIPRDLSILFPDGSLSKINEAYRLGERAGRGQGPELARRVLSETLGVPIDYSAATDFAGFSSLIDDVGGIWVTVERPFIDGAYPDGQGGWLTFAAGPTWMDGTRALQFARSRQGNNDEGSDFARSQRQQRLLVALRQRLLSWSILLKPWVVHAVAGDVASSVQTNLEPWQMASLARFLAEIRIEPLPPIVLTDVLEPVRDSDGTFRLLPRGGSLRPMQHRVVNLLTKPALADVQRDRASACAAPDHSAVPAPEQLAIVPRSAWDLSQAPPPRTRRQEIRGIVIHHDAVVYPPGRSGEEKVRSLWHSVVRMGWPDVSYHYLIDLDGRVFEGAPEWAMTHTRTWHDTANLLHVGLLGNYHISQPSEPQIQSLIQLVELKAREHGIPPNHISFHSDLVATECPGRFVRERLNVNPWCPLPASSSSSGS